MMSPPCRLLGHPGITLNYPRYDYSGHRVLVAGGTSGTGLAVAHAFADAGAEVTVTGAQHLTGFYDADLSRFRYRQLALEQPEAIVAFADATERVDALVVAGEPELPRHLGAADREFVAEASRLGLVGPAQLVRRLRPSLSASPAQGGGSAVVASGAAGWWSLGRAGEAGPTGTLESTTRHLGSSLARYGVRVNAALTPRPSGQAYHVQIERHSPHSSGTLLARPRRVRGSLAEATRSAVVDVVLFLSSAGAAGITGQSMHVG